MYVAVVNLADYLAHGALNHDLSDGEQLPPPDPECVSRLGVSVEDFEQLRIKIIGEYIKSETFLQMASA